MFLLGILCAAPPVSAEPEPGSSLKILICLDGVPLELIRKLQDEGRFHSFRPPAPLISTFPAITEIMLTELFGVEPPPGYGLRYYDKAANELRGGLGDASAISVWFKLYDFVTPMMDRGLTYMWGRWSVRDLDYLRKHLARADSGILLMHLDSTDALMHHERSAVTVNWLRSLDSALVEFLGRRNGQDVEIVLFSDHGNDMRETRRIPIEDHLKRSGWKPGSVIDGESGIAILPTGLISTGYVYTAREAEAAASIAGLRGVELCAYEAGGIAHVTGRNGHARVERRGDASGWRYRYETDSGDPLAMVPVIRAMKDSGLLDADGFADDREWFTATLSHEYPDALNRVYGGVTGHVRNVGDVLMSLDPGWHCGSRVLSAFLNFKGTHGSLRKASITGFAISNRRSLRPLRAEELLDELGWRNEVGIDAATRGVAMRGTLPPPRGELRGVHVLEHREGWDRRGTDAVN